VRQSGCNPQKPKKKRGDLLLHRSSLAKLRRLWSRTLTDLSKRCDSIRPVPTLHNAALVFGHLSRERASRMMARKQSPRRPGNRANCLEKTDFWEVLRLPMRSWRVRRSYQVGREGHWNSPTTEKTAEGPAPPHPTRKEAISADLSPRFRDRIGGPHIRYHTENHSLKDATPCPAI